MILSPGHAIQLSEYLMNLLRKQAPRNTTIQKHRKNGDTTVRPANLPINRSNTTLGEPRYKDDRDMQQCRHPKGVQSTNQLWRRPGEVCKNPQV